MAPFHIIDIIFCFLREGFGFKYFPWHTFGSQKHTKQKPNLGRTNMLDVMGLDGLFRNNPSSHWMRCLTTKFRHLAKKLHPDKPGGSAAQMEELKYAYDYLQGIVQQWIAVTDWTRCQVQCHCSLCLCLYICRL